MITIRLFYYCEKVFILMNISMVGKNSMKYHYLEKNIFIVTWICKILLIQIMHTQKEFLKILKQKIQKNIMICVLKAIHYCQLMQLRNLEICVLKYTNLILQNFFQLPGLVWQATLKKTGVMLDLSTDIVMLLMVEKDIRQSRNMSLYLFNKYMKDYDKNKKS